MRRVSSTRRHPESERPVEQVPFLAVGTEPNNPKTSAGPAQRALDKRSPDSPPAAWGGNVEMTETTDRRIYTIGITVQAADTDKSVPVPGCEKGFARPGESIRTGPPFFAEAPKEAKALFQADIDQGLQLGREI